MEESEKLETEDNLISLPSTQRKLKQYSQNNDQYDNFQNKDIKINDINDCNQNKFKDFNKNKNNSNKNVIRQDFQKEIYDYGIQNEGGKNQFFNNYSIKVPKTIQLINESQNFSQFGLESYRENKNLLNINSNFSKLSGSQTGIQNSSQSYVQPKQLKNSKIKAKDLDNLNSNIIYEEEKNISFQENKDDNVNKQQQYQQYLQKNNSFIKENEQSINKNQMNISLCSQNQSSNDIQTVCTKEVDSSTQNQNKQNSGSKMNLVKNQNKEIKKKLDLIDFNDEDQNQDDIIKQQQNENEKQNKQIQMPKLQFQFNDEIQNEFYDFPSIQNEGEQVQNLKQNLNKEKFQKMGQETSKNNPTIQIKKISNDIKNQEKIELNSSEQRKNFTLRSNTCQIKQNQLQTENSQVLQKINNKFNSAIMKSVPDRENSINQSAVQEQLKEVQKNKLMQQNLIIEKQKQEKEKLLKIKLQKQKIANKVFQVYQIKQFMRYIQEKLNAYKVLHLQNKHFKLIKEFPIKSQEILQFQEKFGKKKIFESIEPSKQNEKGENGSQNENDVVQKFEEDHYYKNYFQENQNKQKQNEESLNFKQKLMKKWLNIQNRKIIWKLLKKLPDIHPESTFALLVQLFFFVFITSSIFFINMNHFFGMEFSTQPYYNSFLIILFMALLGEILFKLKKAIIVEGKTQTDNQKIFKKYKENTFYPDLLCCILVLICIAKQQQDDLFDDVIESLYYIKIYSLFKTVQDIEYIMFMKGVPFHIIQLLKTYGFISILLHFISCFWLLLNTAEIKYGAEDTWLQKNEFESQNWYFKYTQSYFWATCLLMLIGVGGERWIERQYQNIILFITVGLFAYILEVISQIIQDISKDKLQYQRDMETINKYMGGKNLDIQTQVLVRQQLEYCYSSIQEINVNQEAQKILKNLPDYLSQKINTQINHSISQKFRQLQLNFSSKAIEKLLKSPQAMQEISFVQQDVILNPKQKDNHLYLYLVLSGQGHIFGEEQFFTGQQPNFYAKSISFSNICRIQRQGFLDIISQIPQDYETFCYIKDMINERGITKQYKLNCHICQSFYHCTEKCSYVLFRPNKYRVGLISQQQNNMTQERQRLLTNKFYEQQQFRESFIQFQMAENQIIITNDMFQNSQEDIQLINENSLQQENSLDYQSSVTTYPNQSPINRNEYENQFAQNNQNKNAQNQSKINLQPSNQNLQIKPVLQYEQIGTFTENFTTKFQQITRQLDLIKESIQDLNILEQQGKNLQQQGQQLQDNISFQNGQFQNENHEKTEFSQESLQEDQFFIDFDVLKNFNIYYPNYNFKNVKLKIQKKENKKKEERFKMFYEMQKRKQLREINTNNKSMNYIMESSDYNEDSDEEYRKIEGMVEDFQENNQQYIQELQESQESVYVREALLKLEKQRKKKKQTDQNKVIEEDSEGMEEQGSQEELQSQREQQFNPLDYIAKELKNLKRERENQFPQLNPQNHLDIKSNLKMQNIQMNENQNFNQSDSSSSKSSSSSQ
ncbi:Cyclic nucleotide-binding protein [Pseudocohnilembus persalinus]|uniref:Cyclic nucleotide-binding protein n=1 Tax=Pseudocohnilembus persalinus TaxID=266149 RepID=A0A0V0QXH4_PSEPJ|nr:Cyclic nucleotide-binding protein [Pseudocohnilembus persalinus]|eukprot:KRX06765.1 Cyclic nucleotide-binding protein [Pseudocohnilembus persalinus]